MTTPSNRAGIFLQDQPPSLRAGVYTRVSKDVRKGSDREAISVDSQARECRRVADNAGWTIIDKPYCDNDVSASKYSRKSREDWPRMLADLEAGRFDVIVMWESSRGSRKLSEWSAFLETAAEKGVLIHIVSHDRTYDPRRGRDWKTLAGDGVDAEASSNETAERVRRLKAAGRDDGRPDGRLCFGHKREYDPDTRALLRQVPHPHESLVVKEVFRRIQGGDSLIGIANDLNRRANLSEDDPEWVTKLASGTPYRVNSIRQIATRAAHAGKIQHDGTLFDADWAPIVPLSQWHAVQRILSDPRRRTTDRPGRVRYLLTNIICCGACGSRIGAKTISGKIRYTCTGQLPSGRRSARQGCATILRDDIDEYILNKLADVLADESLVSSATETGDGERAAAQARALEMRSELDAMWDRVSAMEPGWAAERVAKVEAAWMPEIRRLQEQAVSGLGGGFAVAARLVAEARANGLKGSALQKVMRSAVRKVPLPGQRELIRTFLPPTYLMPARFQGGHYFFDSQRVRFSRPDGLPEGGYPRGDAAPKASPHSVEPT